MLQLSLFKGLVGRVSVLMVFAVGAVGLFLMMGGLGEGQEHEVVDYPENGTATVVAYIGDDPEGQTVTWSLSGADAGDFEIDGGGLTFRTPPDYRESNFGNDWRDSCGKKRIQGDGPGLGRHDRLRSIRWWR